MDVLSNHDLQKLQNPFGKFALLPGFPGQSHISTNLKYFLGFLNLFLGLLGESGGAVGLGMFFYVG